MRADSLKPGWAALLLAVALLTSGCARLTPPPSRGMLLSGAPRVAAGPALAETPSEEPPRAQASPAPSMPEPEEPQRLHRRKRLREGVTSVAPGRMAGAAAPESQRPLQTRQAVLGAIDEVTGTTGALASALSRLNDPEAGIGARANGVFSRYSLYGSHQLQWIHGALGGATTLASVASEVADADMELGLLRMTGPRLQAAMFGSLLLSAWLDFTNLANAVLRQCPFYSVEALFMDLNRVQRMIEPSMRALASLEPEQVAATADLMPELMGQLTREFEAIREGVRKAAESGEELMLAAQLMEMITMAAMMRVPVPRLPPAVPLRLGVGLVMGSNGVMMGSQVVVSAEWVERIRRLVQAGVISVHAASAAVRIHAGQAMMSQGHQDLPQGVREALGDGPEVRAMHETGKAGAGMAEQPRHHTMPRAQREWFEKRGFTGDMDIDNFCVEVELANHQAIHGGGNWRLARRWPGEWNQLIMKALRDAEIEVGRMLTRSEILDIVADHLRRYHIPMKFTPWRGP